MMISFTLLLVFLTNIINGALPNGYAPANVACPKVDSFLREGNDTSPRENAWLEQKQKKTNAALIDFLDSSNLTNFDAEKFINSKNSKPINIGLAFSRGGYRAMMAGAGQFAGLDNRTDIVHGNSLGGILQSASYVSSVSGGAWLIGSMALQNWPTIDEVALDNSEDLWNLTETRKLVNESASQLSLYWDVFMNHMDGALTHINNWSGVKKSVDAKKNAGYGVTTTDYWSRALAYQLYPKKDNHLGSTSFSDIQNMSVFANYDMPFPIVLALGRKPGTLAYGLKWGHLILH